MKILSTVILMLVCVIIQHSASASERLNPNLLPFEAKRVYQKFLIAEKENQKKLTDSLLMQIREYEKRGDEENVDRVTNFLDAYQLSLKKQVVDRQTAKIKCEEKFVSFRKGMQFALDHPAPFTVVPEEFAGEKVSMRYNQVIGNQHEDLFFEVVHEGDVFIMVRKSFSMHFEADGWECYSNAERHGEFTPVHIVILKQFLSPGTYSLPSFGHMGTRIFDL